MIHKENCSKKCIKKNRALYYDKKMHGIVKI